VIGSRIEFFLVSILFFPAILIPAFAEDTLFENEILVVGTDKSEYKIGGSATISGKTQEKKMPVVAMSIFDPDGTILSANPLEINEDNSFSKVIFFDSPYYDKVGTYTIKLDYGKLKTETTFEIISEVDENSNTSLIGISEISIPEISITINKSVYQDEDTVIIEGTVSALEGAMVLVAIYDPFGIPTGIYFSDVDSNLEFAISFLVKSGVNFKTEGTYSIIASYGESKSTTEFDFFENLVESIEPTQITGEPIETNENSVNDNEPIETSDISLDDNIPMFDNKQQNVQSTNNLQNIKTATKGILKVKAVSKNIEEAKKKESENLLGNSKHLTVEDIELGKMLNQIYLKCNTSELVDSISYYDSMGPALIRLCKYDEAISYYDETLIENPNNVEVLSNKGSALGKLGLYNEAIDHYDSALSIDPNYVHALNNKANALASLDLIPDAISTYNQALLIAPDNIIILNNLENTKQKLEKYEEQTTEETNEEPKQSTKTTIKSQKMPDKNEDNTTPTILDQIGSALDSIKDVFFGFLN